MGKRNKKSAGGGGGGGGGGHGEGGMMRWLITYADLITLLLAFFVVMFSISQTDLKKYQALAGSLQAAFNIEMGGRSGSGVIPLYPSGGSTSGAGNQEVDKKLDEITKEKLAREKLAEQQQQMREDTEFKKVAERIDKYAREEGIRNYITMEIDERGLLISIQDTVFFESGKAELTPKSKEILDKVAKIIFPLPNHIRIEGHTDNVPINTPKYPSNWQLSTDRATTVLVYLIEKHGFPPTRLSAAGYGEYRPRVPNDSEANRALNRRVDIVILRSSVNGSTSTENNDLLNKPVTGN